MKNYLLKIAYDGADYHGWQVQENALTVQQLLQDAIEQIFGKRYSVIGCSRTDAGVHALEFCCNFKADCSIPDSNIPFALNSKLPDAIVVKKCVELDLDFHARYDCRGKEYTYIIHNSIIKDPFLRGRAWEYKHKLNPELMNLQCKDFIKTADFSAFCASGSSVEDKIRTIYSASVEQKDDNIYFKVCGNGFLYNMVRIMAGTLVDISQGRIKPNSIDDIIESRNRENAGITAPACGLYLSRVLYDFEF